MKNLLIRIMALAMFATSLSAFAASGKPKAGKDPNPRTSTAEPKLAPCPTAAQQNDQQPTCLCQSEDSKEKTQRQKLIQKEDQEWLHNLENSSGL
jgi:hypothetical protein